MKRSLNMVIKSVAALLAAIVIMSAQAVFIPSIVSADTYNPNIVTFVTSLYSDCLGRTPDPTGLNDWCGRLARGEISGKECAYGFFYSNEFKAKANRMTSIEMITAYYRVFLNRTPDEGGLNYWVAQIANTTNDLSILFTGFADSNEFSQKCTSYGVRTGSHIDVPTTVTLHADEIYNAMIAYQGTYPEGTPWTNANYAPFRGGYYSGGYGCAGFAFMLSDAAFGSMPARMVYSMDNIRVGDIIRMNNNGHSVIVLAVDSNGVTVAEGNYAYSVHWGRYISYGEMAQSFNYVMTRYPES